MLGVRLPVDAPMHPVLSILRRFLLAVLIVVINWVVVILESGQYRDAVDGEVSWTDALYYTTVTLSTTGYGDITPVTTTARLVNTFFVTPMRLLFVVILVGTTIQALTERSREQYRLGRWRSRVKDHVVVVGYGTKGRNAVRALLLKGHPLDRIVVIDPHPEAVAQATAAGLVAVAGSATSADTLRDALVDRASVVIVALGRDDTAVLVTLAARRFAPNVTVVATVREAESSELLRQSGARSVIVSAETAGRLLGLAADSPDTVEVVEDMLSFGSGLDLVERAVVAQEVGRGSADLLPPVLAVLRNGEKIYYDDPRSRRLEAGDRIVQAILRSGPAPAEADRAAARVDRTASQADGTA